jgi:hypothetical protein
VELRLRWRATHRAALIGVVALVGCGAASSPEEFVAFYFQTLGRDPVRSAALVTPAFHAQHGLRIQSAWTDTASPEQPFRLSSAELAWLGVQRRPEYLAYAPKLVVSDIETKRSDSQQAVVVARVAAPAVPPFVQRFFLLRSGPDAPWQIDRIEQEGVVPANKTAAFVASPSRADGRAPSASDR